MAWPFTTPASAPTSFAGPGASVPTSATEIGGAAALTLLGLHFVNTDTADHIVTVTDTAGGIVWKESIPAGSGSQPYDPTFEPMTGLKWSADAGAGTTVKGHAWGY